MSILRLSFCFKNVESLANVSKCITNENLHQRDLQLVFHSRLCRTQNNPFCLSTGNVQHLCRHGSQLDVIGLQWALFTWWKSNIVNLKLFDAGIFRFSLFNLPVLSLWLGSRGLGQPRPPGKNVIRGRDWALSNPHAKQKTVIRGTTRGRHQALVKNAAKRIIRELSGFV